MARAIERQVREHLPAVTIDSETAFERAQELVAGRPISGTRPRSSEAAPLLRVFYPDSYDGAFVAEAGPQRIALRAVGARFAPMSVSDGKLFYPGAHDSVDVIELAGAQRSEELLLLHDSRAPRTFDYEIVEMRGTTGMILTEGAIRFVPERAPAPDPPDARGTFTAVQPLLQIDRPWVIDADGKRSDDAKWTIVDDHTIRLTITTERFPLIVDPSFSAVGTMEGARANHTATLLPNGKVLIAGGMTASYLATAEIYDPATGTFTATGNMKAARGYHSATLLPNGKVLIAGGAFLSSAELYDPATGTFAWTGSMSVARKKPTATLLPNGKVLITGGYTGTAYPAAAELYDPATGTFTATTGPMSTGRLYHTAALLADGKVLIAGGYNGAYLASAEVFNPATGTFTATTGTMTATRAFHSATTLTSGKVLIAGGYDRSDLNSAELYDPTAGTFAATGAMSAPRSPFTATLMPNGKVLVSGGYNTSNGYLSTTEIYDPLAATFSNGPAMNSVHLHHTATLLPDGRIVMAGGYDGASYLNTAELYYSGSGTFSLTGSMTAARGYRSSATLLTNGKVLVVGGLGQLIPVGLAELYDPLAGAFAPSTGTTNDWRTFHTATLLPGGKVLIAGGQESVPLNTAELYDSDADSFSPVSAMSASRHRHTATLLQTGDVLVAGGSGLASAEIFEPSTGAFSSTGSMHKARALHTATLLPNGQVLVTGGASDQSAGAELYDATTRAFTTTASMSVARSSHTATLLPNGKVLIAGGENDTSLALNTAELYDPATGTFTATTGNMTTARTGHMAVLLPGGKVLIAGGFDGTYTAATLYTPPHAVALSSAELYDPITNTFAATASMAGIRDSMTATMLPNGKVLVAGGRDSWGLNQPPVSSAELYDPGAGYSSAQQPVITSIMNPVCQPATLIVSGSRFTGVSEGSNGATNNSATNLPLLRLRRLDNDQEHFVTPQSTSSTSFSASLSELPSGHYGAAIISNAIPSSEANIDVETTPLLPAYSTASMNFASSATLSPSSLPAGYNGSLYPLRLSAPTFTGTITLDPDSGAISVNDARPAGTHTVTVSSISPCATVSTSFSLNVSEAPSSISATSGATQGTLITTAFASPLGATVRDSAGHPLSGITVTFTAPGSGATATLSNGGVATTNASGVASVTATANGTPGSYNVTATVSTLTATFALTNMVAVPGNVFATATTATSVTVTWSATAGATYEVQRLGAGSVSTTFGPVSTGSYTDTTVAPSSAYLYKVRAITPNTTAFSSSNLATTVIFTDPTLVARSTGVKAVHFTELQAAVSAVRALAGRTTFSFTDAPFGPTVAIRSIHLLELRSALNEARTSLGLGNVVYAYSGETGTSIRKIDIEELRNGVR